MSTNGHAAQHRNHMDTASSDHIVPISERHLSSISRKVQLGPSSAPGTPVKSFMRHISLHERLGSISRGTL